MIIAMKANRKIVAHPDGLRGWSPRRMGGGERHRWQRIVNLFLKNNNQHHHEVPDAPQFHDDDDDDVADGDGDIFWGT